MIQLTQFWVFIQRIQKTNSKRYMYPYVDHSIIYNSQNMGTTYMDKEDMVYIYLYIYNGMLLSHIKDEILPL